MRKAGKIIAILVILALILVPLTACEEEAEVTKITVEAGTTGSQGEEGVAGAPGRAGEQGLQGEQGEPGEAGATWYTGAGVPTAATGANDDLYLNTANGDVYKKVSGTWTKVANLKGPQGDQGPEGDQGSSGGAMGTETPIRQITVCETNTVLYDIYYTSSVPPGEGSQAYVEAPISEGSEPKYIVTWYVYPTQTVTIMGAGFDDVVGETISITICENDTFWASATVNACGAFRIDTTVPTWATLGAVSVRAWLYAGFDGNNQLISGDLQAVWPLYIAEVPV